VEREQSPSLECAVASLKVSNVQINKSLDGAEKRPEIEQGLSDNPANCSFQTVGPDALKHRPPYVDSLTGGSASWFLHHL